MGSSVLQRPAALARRNVEVRPHPVRTTRARARQHMEHGGMGRGDDERPCLSELEGTGDRGCPLKARVWQAGVCIPLFVNARLRLRQRWCTRAECSPDCVGRRTSDQLRCTRRNRAGAALAVRRSEQARPERTLCPESNRVGKRIIRPLFRPPTCAPCRLARHESEVESGVCELLSSDAMGRSTYFPSI